MPELPEVERARKSLMEVATNRYIKSAIASDDTIVYSGVLAQDLALSIVGKKVLDVKRKGKNFYVSDPSSNRHQRALLSLSTLWLCHRRTRH